MSAARTTRALHPSVISIVTCGLSALIFLVATLPAATQTSANTSFFEFGTVVAINRQSIDIQTFDPQRQRLVQHSFQLTKETRADIVHVGDAVEVVFLPSGGEWTLKRMIVLPSGIPMAGPPPPAVVSQPRVQAAVPYAPAPAVPAATSQPVLNQPGVNQAAARQGSIPQPAPMAAAKPKPVKPRSRTKPASAPALVAKSAPPPPSLGVADVPRTPNVVHVDLGASSDSLARLNAPGTKVASIDRPAEECNRSSADWPAQPLRLAVLDFRYPTEREEAHDIGTTGGGSGTAVADLVFERLEQAEQVNDSYLVSRADRRRLDRSDFAGAARLGRQLGVDAVLAGTFVPIAAAGTAPDDLNPVKAYELRAGIVDTCTGQLLLQTSSVSCPGSAEPGLTIGSDPASCSHLAASLAETADPKAHATAFKPLLDDLLFPLEHNATPGSRSGALGTVVAAQGREVTLQLASRSTLRAGDQVSIQASRLAKNPTTYTLRNLQSEEIGRLTVRDVQDGTARGSYTGDYPPRPGDTAQTIP